MNHFSIIWECPNLVKFDEQILFCQSARSRNKEVMIMRICQNGYYLINGDLERL